MEGSSIFVLCCGLKRLQSPMNTFTTSSNDISLTGILLAAGRSSRAGGLKALFEWNGETMIGSILFKLAELCNRIIVVTGFEHHRIEEAVLKCNRPNVDCVQNDRWESGMFSSIQAGIRACTAEASCILHMVDQPHLPGAVYETLYSAFIHSSHAMYIPTWNDRRGHPLIFRSEVGNWILGNTPMATMCEAIQSFSTSILHVPVACEEILHTINTPEDFAFIKQHYSHTLLEPR